MVTQSSGTALAGPLDFWPKATLAALINPLRSIVSGSQIYAMAMGTTNRYDAMHAPAPIYRRPEKMLDAALIMRSVHPLTPVSRMGVPRTFVMPPRSELDPRHRRLDPLAMQKPVVKPATIIRRTHAVPFGTLALARHGSTSATSSPGER